MTPQQAREQGLVQYSACFAYDHSEKAAALQALERAIPANAKAVSWHEDIPASGDKFAVAATWFEAP